MNYNSLAQHFGLLVFTCSLASVHSAQFPILLSVFFIYLFFTRFFFKNLLVQGLNLAVLLFPFKGTCAASKDDTLGNALSVTRLKPV